ncbi:hypothetical protein HJFPF1_08002 [Paramyrothecium foliicola]|nr:hypothetical protein HJFPF1_08002 [Paramyrothecium foliicola]
MAARNSLLDLIDAVDNVPPGFEHDWAPYYRLLLAPDPRPHGFVHPDTVRRMPWPPAFAVDHASRAVTLSAPGGGSADPHAAAAAHANEAFQQAVDAAIEQGLFAGVLAGRHSEHFRVLGARGFVQVERFAATLFGIATRGAHLTAYVRGERGDDDDDDDDLKIWVARRSSHLFTYPGMLDSTVAGGVKAADSPLACILAESAEEASLPAASVAPRVRPVGVVTALNRAAATGLVHGDVVHVFDLEMAAGERGPLPCDDEVAEFVLMGCAEVRRRMVAGEFKPNVCLVLIDFLVRHGRVTPETEGEAAYVEICTRLRRRLPMPIMPSV